MSMTEIALILVIAVVLFGPEDLPVVARTLGKIIFQVRKFTNEVTREFRGALSAPNGLIQNALKEDPPKDKPAQSKKIAEDEELLSYQEIEEPSPDKQENQKDMQAGE
ncbi:MULTISPECIES: twin-arginine translocase TatA/TatE family subunit [unclassified Dehalobacter]|uniref:Sec-independent protein translocase subunit TatA/TatB n=1 Tax=unclassified Dehalobacter TaxID=2635733 RepID=UPI000E6C2830|nr:MULTISPECIES: twin-arginine translocase TatA/TatE family subunit [unclassified Dehalobacter]RJE46918.1 Twin-arginine translocation protein [Dehalobacter sp. MCB1]TCX50842.1 Twin-arginine translocation protein [Dehalobacter sp. 12DCB1]TCX51553.1 Twin-arginine translocation protein [Dehalobacter sp. 14DCB1]